MLLFPSDSLILPRSQICVRDFHNVLTVNLKTDNFVGFRRLDTEIRIYLPHWLIIQLVDNPEICLYTDFWQRNWDPVTESGLVCVYGCLSV